MALSNFFKINFPYGIKSNEHGEWVAFNREYKPLGFNDSLSEFNFEEYPLYTAYDKFDINKILNLIDEDISRIQIDEKGKIKKYSFIMINRIHQITPNIGMIISK